MKTGFISVLVALGALVSTPALADSKQAESCVRSAMWEAWSSGWSNQAMRSADLEPGGAKHFLVTLDGGRQYAFLGCGDEGVKNLDMMVYDLDGHVVARDYSFSSTARVEFSPTQTGGYYVVMHARETLDSTEPSSVAVAVTYR